MCMSINFAGQDHGLMQNWLVGGCGGCRLVYLQPMPALPQSPAVPELSHLLWGADGQSPGQEEWTLESLLPPVQPVLNCPRSANMEISVIQTDHWSSHQGQVYFFFWKYWSLLLFLDCSATEHSEHCMHQQGTRSAWTPTNIRTGRCHCQRITEKSRLWHQLCHQNPNPITAGAKGLWFQTPRESRLFMV